MAVQGASSSSLSSFTHSWKYDVFLSFRGEDTRNNFTAHLYAALVQKGIDTYRDDDKLQRGEEISQALSEAIESSRISVVVLSENYASSRWCLEELAMIIDSKKTKQQTVLPVFYEVDPTEVRHQSGSFGKAWAELKDRLNDETKVQRWESALTEVAGLAGFTSVGRNESEFIQEVILKVFKVVKSKSLNHISEHLVGMQSRVQDIHNKLPSVEVNDATRILGIFGIGGVGKTTLAKEIYNSFLDQFQYSCFLANVRETSQREDGLIRLQEFLYKIFNAGSLKVQNEDEGIGLIKKMLWRKKVLLVLDDVDQLFQVENLLGDRDRLGDWLGLGSLIIITTRDERLLTNYNVHLLYKMKELYHNEALRLFCWNAFKKEEPSQGFAELTENFLRYAGGLPLALKVLGSYLRKREEIKFWEDALEKYKRIPPDNIQDKLRIGYDGLEESEKNIFLDIACFFAGEREKYVTNRLNGCGFFPHTGIPILREKSLITIEYGTINMHDLLKVMGKEIVRKESDKDPGKRTRLWFHEDVRYVLEQNKGTNSIEGILIDLPKKDLIHLSPGAFEKMKMVRVLINRNALFSEPPNYFSNELRVLDFKNYHGSSLPSNFNGEKLVDLRMDECKLKEFGKIFQNLKFLILSQCDFLKRIPDMSRLPNLKQLDISWCRRLVEVDQSIGSLSKLVFLSIEYCHNLNSFPSSLNSRSLKKLLVNFCRSLVSFPKMGPEMKCLTWIKWNSTSIKELHSSIGNLKLRFLDLGGNDYLSLPLLPSSTLDSSMFTNCFSTLKELNLSRSTFVILPGWMDRFVQLRELILNNCKKLKKIEALPPNIAVVNARGCRSLKSFPEVSKRFEFNTSNKSRLHSIDLHGCSKMLVNVGSHVAAILRPQNYFWDRSCGLLFPGNKIPNWFSHCKETSNSCSSDIFIEVELLKYPSVIKGILTCAVTSEEVVYILIEVHRADRHLGIIRREVMCSNHVWLALYDLEPFTIEGSLQVHFHCCDLYDEPLVSMKRCGVHLVHKDEENAKRKHDDDDKDYSSDSEDDDDDDNLEDGNED